MSPRSPGTSAGFGEAGQCERCGDGFVAGGGGLQLEPEVFFVGGSHGDDLAVAVPAVEGGEGLLGVVGGHAGVEEEHGAQVQAPPGERDGELLALDSHGVGFTAEQGPQDGGVLAVEDEAC